MVGFVWLLPVGFCPAEGDSFFLQPKLSAAIRTAKIKIGA